MSINPHGVTFHTTVILYPPPKKIPHLTFCPISRPKPHQISRSNCLCS